MIVHLGQLETHVLYAHIALRNLAVDPDFQRQGVGRALVQWGTERAAVDQLPVYLAATPQAAGLYKSLGFTERMQREVGSLHIATSFMVKWPEPENGRASVETSSCN
jgi:ribosomal protein S18 acetylase RimI-like enzyme